MFLTLHTYKVTYNRSEKCYLKVSKKFKKKNQQILFVFFLIQMFLNVLILCKASTLKHKNKP